METNRPTGPAKPLPIKANLVWLALGTALLVVSNGLWVMPLAAWLAPVFLIRFSRRTSFFPGLAILMAIHCAAWMVMAYGFKPILTQKQYLALAWGYGIIFWLPYVADRILSHRLTKFWATLVFPATWVVVDYLVTIFHPYTSVQVLGYTQFGNLALMQLLSVTGIYGLTFLVGWAGPVVNLVWEMGFDLRRVKPETAAFVLTMILVLLGGQARLVFSPPALDTVRVAAVMTPKGITSQPRKHLLRKENWQGFKQITRRSTEYFSSQSERAVAAGAKIVAWQEDAVWLLREDENRLIKEASRIARENKIYLAASVYIFSRGDIGGHTENSILWFGPGGELLCRYIKTHPVPGDPDKAGPGKVPILETPYGRIGSVICFDMAWPYLARRGGKAGMDILIVPSDLWWGMDPGATRHANFRAVETGSAMLIAAGEGNSRAVDHQGRQVALQNYFATTDHLLVADLPTPGRGTLYCLLGDWVVWLCLAGLIFMAYSALTSREDWPEESWWGV